MSTGESGEGHLETAVAPPRANYLILAKARALGAGSGPRLPLASDTEVRQLPGNSILLSEQLERNVNIISSAPQNVRTQTGMAAWVI